MVLDSQEPTIPFEEYAYNENRYRALKQANPELAAELMKQADAISKRKYNYIKHLASWTPGK